MNRSIGILRDGYSDYLVISKFIKCVFKKHKNEVLLDSCFIDFEQLNIINPLTKYLNKASKTSTFSYYTPDAEDLIKSLHSVYYACYSRFLHENDNCSNKDIVIINADAERLLMDKANYFKEWAYHIKGILYYSIERFYDEMVKQGHTYDYLPYFIPLILFPSSEILIAPCIDGIECDNIRELRPTPSLKVKVYGTDSINEAIQTGSLGTTLDTYLNEDKLSTIYREIPEARMLIHKLAM